MTIRNLVLDNIANAMTFHCKYEERGCAEATLRAGTKVPFNALHLYIFRISSFDLRTTTN